MYTNSDGYHVCVNSKTEKKKIKKLNNPKQPYVKYILTTMFIYLGVLKYVMIFDDL